jgi:hypothetical protein
MVKLMAAIGIPEHKMVHAVVNPETNRGITPVTLRKHFREELDQGLVQADIKAGANLLKLTETSAAAAIFWAKCRLQWRERVAIEVPGPAAANAAGNSPDPEKAGMLEVARRVAFVLTIGADIEGAPPKPAIRGTAARQPA